MYTPPTPTRRDKTVSSRRRRRCVLGLKYCTTLHVNCNNNCEIIAVFFHYLRIMNLVGSTRYRIPCSVVFEAKSVISRNQGLLCWLFPAGFSCVSSWCTAMQNSNKQGRSQRWIWDQEMFLPPPFPLSGYPFLLFIPSFTPSFPLCPFFLSHSLFFPGVRNPPLNSVRGSGWEHCELPRVWEERGRQTGFSAYLF